MSYEIIMCSNIDELISKLKNTSYIYGDINAYSDTFNIIDIYNLNFRIGIVYYYVGLNPNILIIESDIIFIGFDQFVLYSHKNIIKNNRLNSLFYDFIKIELFSLLVIICELDIIVMRYDASIVWSIGFKDIIVNYKFIEEKNILYISCLDEEEFNLNILNGKIN